MILPRCVACIPRPLLCLVLAILFPPVAIRAARWDSGGAAQAMEQAELQRAELARTGTATLGRYRECAETYRKVYLRDPHFAKAAEAIYEEGQVYLEMGDRFDPEYHKTAARRFRLLVSDYPGHRRCPDALIRLGDLYSNRLKDEDAARGVYETLKREYGYSEASLKRIREKSVEAAAPPAASRPSSEPAEMASVDNIRFWTGEDSTRVIIDMAARAKYAKERLLDPDRIYFDLSDASLNPAFSKRTFAIGDRVLKQIRIGQYRPGVVRIVLDTAPSVDFSVSEMNNPFRLVIDLRPKATLPPAIVPSAPASQTVVAPRKIEPAVEPRTAKQTEAADIPRPPVKQESPAPPKQAEPTSRGDRTLTRMLGLKVGRIVIDPGHGGHDLGTVGPKGLVEKDLVLALAKRLKTMIEENLGAEVILTRSDDTFVPLEERTSLANQHKADLFISIHANSSRIRSISGVETYYLDFAKNDAERQIAARENATATANVSDLENLIKKITRAEKSSESRELAALVQTKLYSGARQMAPWTQNRGVRSAPFVVLIGANMPSILAEVAFISNPKDERLLEKEKNRELVAKALFSGVEGYMKTLGTNVVHNQNSAKD